MQGLAKRLFFEQKGSKPWKREIRTFPKKRRPFLEELCNIEQLNIIDLCISDSLMAPFEETSECCAAFLSYLSASVRYGHVCIKIEESQLFPHPTELWEGDTQETFVQMVREGAASLPEPLWGEKICREENRYYFQRYWKEEKDFLSELERIERAYPRLGIEKNKLETIVGEWVEKGVLLEEQGKAILLAGQHNSLLICGGPGTGKTYTAGRLISALSEASEKEGEMRIALAAPTGKAAANLQASLVKATGGKFSMQAKTLHALVGYGRRSGSREKIAADLVVIDESSMIDVTMMRRLFSNLRSGTRLVLLGDPFQLPPIETGALFTDLVDKLPTVTLKRCLRAELQEIVEFAEAIKQGKKVTFENYSAIKKKALPHKKQGHPALLQEKAAYYDSKGKSEEELLQFFQGFRILSPLKRGPWGVEAINELFYNHAIRNGKNRKQLVFPIMITKNDGERDLYNGETGVLVRQGPVEQGWCRKGDFALFPGKNTGELRRIPALLLPDYSLAYCLSIHKSQGSEFDHILMLLPNGSEKFGRELLYTGVTRTRKGIEIWADDEVLDCTVKKKQHRLSGI